MKRTVGKKRWARKFIGTHVNQMAAFLLTEGIAFYGRQRMPDGSVVELLAVRRGLADKWVDEDKWYPNEHFLYKVWYYADYTQKTIPKYLAQAMIAFAYLNHALQRAQEDEDAEMIDLIKRATKDYDYKSKIRRGPINERKIIPVRSRKISRR